MRTIANHALSGLLALALSIALLPAAADAQEKQQEAGAEQQEACTAQVSPEAVETGQVAVRVKATLSSSVGQVAELRAPEGSGLALASPADIPKSEMAREGEQPEPRPVETATGGEQPVVTAWLDTEDASTGSHEVVLVGADGECAGTLEVAASSDQEQPGG